MTAEVEGEFQVTSWDEQTYQDLSGSSKLTRVTVVQQYRGGLEATSSWAGLMFYRDDGTAFYNGLQQFVGTLDGRHGTFVAETRGEYDKDQATSQWDVVRGSGTGDLAGLEGSGTALTGVDAAGSYAFEYDIH